MRGHPRETTGRNAPCPCGSGRKYKHCCLEKASTEDQLWRQVHAAFEVVQSQLPEFGAERFGDLHEFAWSDYHFGEPPKTPSENYSDLALFIPYFLYRWRPARKKTLPSGDTTIAHAYLRQHGGALSELERQVVGLGLSEPFTFYEIRPVVPGQQFLLQELFTGKQVLVKERAGCPNERPAGKLYGQTETIQTLTALA